MAADRALAQAAARDGIEGWMSHMTAGAARIAEVVRGRRAGVYRGFVAPLTVAGRTILRNLHKTFPDS